MHRRIIKWKNQSNKAFQGTYRDTFECMEAVAPGKMVALAECAALPDPVKSFTGNLNFAPWLYGLPWFRGNEENPCNWVDLTLNSDYIIAMDELTYAKKNEKYLSSK